MRESRVSIVHKATRAVTELSLTGRIVFFIFVGLFIGSVLWMLYDINVAFLVTVPKPGGTLTDGVVGEPRFINPVLASSDPDRDISALVYSGLTRFDIQSQKLIPDLAQSWSVSPDGLTYTFILKNNITFQDGTPVTAADVVFTVQTIQNPDIRSPLAATWAGITVQEINQQTVQFILPAPYKPFIENTTLGILPKHLWQNVDPAQFPFSPLESNPIGSGPYRISAISKDKTGVPITYELSPFTHFTLGLGLLGKIDFRFYKTQDAVLSALETGEITTTSGISPADAPGLTADGFSLQSSPLPRVFGIFFNQSEKQGLADPAVRRALDVATDRQTLVTSVFGPFAKAIAGPVPALFLANAFGPGIASSSVPSASSTLADSLLDKAGWIRNTSGIREKKIAGASTTLAFSISTSDAPELVAVANALAGEWRRIGVDVSVKVFGDGLEDNVIRPRNYDALLFGQVVGRDFDLYPFWASTQAADPGLNIASYANPSADTLLVQMRTTASTTIEAADYQQFSALLTHDEPAIFIYEPDLISVVPPTLAGEAAGSVSAESERFSDAYQWYLQTERVWRIFTRTNESGQNRLADRI
jgi:peptide/nickel transport system substrate-binding protein